MRAFKSSLRTAWKMGPVLRASMCKCYKSPKSDYNQQSILQAWIDRLRVSLSVETERYGVIYLLPDNLSEIGVEYIEGLYILETL
ncbi:uncharacterized protein LOC115967452 isoform X2 [Quercus lobata]|uniref:uncharacterized protein LOC115967452 isoform X2 n=1 Tax=Quercus lobata TaxID=97700 RepID=UPI0012491BDE|nr:uncharacterized protein LOC115967452 isoform X2 [Quercus lobata]